LTRLCWRVSVVLIALLLIGSIAVAAPPTSMLYKVRSSQSPEKLRIVFDLDNVPIFNVALEQKPHPCLVIDVPASLASDVKSKLSFKDQFVKGLQMEETKDGLVQITVDLIMVPQYKVFVLKNPNRLVVDLDKIFEQKTERDIIPGMKYTSWVRSIGRGPVDAKIITLNPRDGLSLKPVLSNDAIRGLEELSAMSARVNAVAAVNGSYFAHNGEIIGLMKFNDEIISTPSSVERTALGLMPDGRMIFDQVGYQGSVTLPGGNVVPVSGVNRERGVNELIVYNSYYGPSTGTNDFGSEYLLDKEGKITAIARGNTPIGPDDVVLSVHGAAALALADLKVGDRVTIHQTLGQLWDKAVYVLGAGPMLVKNGDLFLTSTVEQFPADIAIGRAPRTAIGIDKDGNLLLVVVDGRQPSSIGMTLLELAQFLRELGAVDAMNLDGGGSSELVINGEVMNRPSDGKERRIGDALAVMATNIAN